MALKTVTIISFLLLLSLCLGQHTPSFRERIFTNRGQCLIISSKAQNFLTFRARIRECAIHCATFDHCVGFHHSKMEEKDGVNIDECALFQKTDIMFREECLSPNSYEQSPKPIPFFYQKKGECHNGGVWNKQREKCFCGTTVDSLWVGDYCSSVPLTCDDFVVAGYDTLFGYGPPIMIKESHNGIIYTAPTICKIDQETKMSIANFASFFDTEISVFNKSWVQMEDGFREGRNVWVGLRAMRNQVEKVKQKDRFLKVRISIPIKIVFN